MGGCGAARPFAPVRRPWQRWTCTPATFGNAATACHPCPRCAGRSWRNVGRSTPDSAPKRASSPEPQRSDRRLRAGGMSPADLSESDVQQRTAFARMPTLLGALGSFVLAVPLVGWSLRALLQVTPSGEFVAMQYTTSLGFVVAGAAVV